MFLMSDVDDQLVPVLLAYCPFQNTIPNRGAIRLEGLDKVKSNA